MPLRVLHLVGSPVSRFYCDLSMLYARGCLEATADPGRYSHHVALVEPGGGWRLPDGLDAASVAAAPVVPVAEALARIADLGIDLAVPQMFCLPGMTAYRSLLEVVDIPYIGNRPDVMALGAHKARARAVVAAAGVAVPAGTVVRPGEVPPARAPVVVKPVDADNSLGVTLVRDATGLPAALAAAYEHSGAAIVEDYVEAGREVRCATLERGGHVVCLPLEEYDVHPTTRPIRVLGDKIGGSGADLRLLAKGPGSAWIVGDEDPAVPAVHEAARRCHDALGCRHYGLFDFRIDPSGQPWFLEAGLYCSFSRQSVIAVMAAAAGTPVAELFAASVGDVVDRR